MSKPEMSERGRLLLPLMLLLGCTHAGTVPLEEHDDRYGVCAARGPHPVTQGHALSLTGTLWQLRDESPFDGPVKMVLIDGAGAPHKLYFPSLYTRPSPAPDVIATQKRIVRSKVGDCVQIDGSPTTRDPAIWVDRFTNLDRP